MLWVLSKTMTLLLLPIYSSARPQRTPASDLPTPLQKAIPTCAQSCVSATIASTFPSLACLKPDELDSFCCQYSSVAFALEQLILGCIKTDCPSSTSDSFASVQKICDGSGNASKSTKTPAISTKTTLSARSSTKSTRTTSVESDIASGTSTSKISESNSPVISKSTSEVLVPGETTKPVTITSTQTPPVISSINEEEIEEQDIENEESDDDSESLTTGQVVGISMSVVGALAFSVGAISSIAYFRRRRLQRRVSKDETFDFQSSSRPSLDLNTMLENPKGAAAIKRPEAIADLAQTRTPPHFTNGRRLSTSGTQPSNIGVAISSEARTDKVFPEASTIKTRKPLPMIRTSSASVATVFEEDRRSALDKKPTKIKTLQHRASATSDQSIETPPFLYEDQLSDQQEKPPVPPKPSLSVQIPAPKSGPEPRFVQPYSQNQQNSSNLCSPKLVTASRLVAMLATRPPNDNNPSNNESSNRNSFEYIPQYYTTPRNQLGGLDGSWEYDASGGRKLEPSSRSSSFAKRDSRASETSFETMVPDEETPPANEPKKLSPVVESPISGLRYPKVPRASNQLVARQSASLRDSSDDESSKSPIRTPLSARRHRRETSDQSSAKSPNKCKSGHQSKLSPSKTSASVSSDEGWQILGLKDETAMVAPLRIHSQHNPVSKQDDSVRQTQGIPDSSEQDFNLKSPLWDPRLYPWRKGDELFLYLK